MDDREIEKILDNALVNHQSQTSEQVSDKVQVASTVFISRTLKLLSSKIENLNYSLHHEFESLSRNIREFDNSLKNQTEKLIESNENLSRSSDNHAKWMRCLTIALVITTLFVGVLQAFVIWKTNKINQRIEFLQEL